MVYYLLCSVCLELVYICQICKGMKVTFFAFVHKCPVLFC
jgi:hypothetical protein